MKNPFEVNTPEGISAQDAYDLFVLPIFIKYLKLDILF